MKVRISRSAEQDLSSGFEFYGEQAEGVGAYFLASLYADIEALRYHAGIHRQISGYYRCQAKRFPYAIYYFITGDVVNVRAVLDSRRAPAWIRDGLTDPT